MHGYMQDMGNTVSQDCLTVLPDNRELKLFVSERGSSIASIQYELRSLDLSRLIEKGAELELKSVNDSLAITIPIQNLIEKNRQYLLRLTVDIGEHSVYYYTRVIWLENDFSGQILELAEDFSRRSFSKTDARGLSPYLESTDTADNSSLSRVNLRSSFQQITFGASGMRQSGDFYIRLKELDGVMGEVQVSYYSSCTDRNGNPRRFWNVDDFVFRYDPQRIFIMSFDRSTEELFGIEHAVIKDERLLMGVQREDSIESLQSSSGQFTAFKAGKELYRYENTSRGRLLKLFSYDSDTRSETNAVSRADYDMRILSVKNNGDIDFAVYGYISRGQHEGYSGILYYTYDNSEDTVVENLFIPIADNSGRIMEDTERVAYLSGNGLFYFYYSGAVYGVDTNSFEVVTVTEGLKDRELVSTESCRYIAFQDKDSPDSYHSEKIVFMDLSTDKSFEIREDGSYLRVLGFIGEDLVYGLNKQTESDIGTLRHEIPMYELRIMDSEQQLKTEYRKDGIYFGNAELGRNRIHFEEYNFSNGKYSLSGDDSIISNRENQSIRTHGLDSYKDSELQKCWALIVLGESRGNIQGAYPSRYSLEKASTVEIARRAQENEGLFYAYSLGSYAGRYRTLENACRAAHEGFGYVKDLNGRTLWNRTDKETVVRIREPLDKASRLIEWLSSADSMDTDNDMLILDAYGMDLNSVLYYVAKGYPVAGFTSDKGYELISGYSSGSITLTSSEDGSERALGRAEGEALFLQEGNRFFAYISE